jgi:hypothetical protein
METVYNNPNVNWYHKEMPNPKQGCFSWMVAIIVLIVFSICMSSCETIKYVPVETVKTEVIHNTDAVIVKDTINNEKETIIREATPADSLLLAKVGIQLDESKRVILLLQKELAEKSHTEIEHTSDTVTVEKEVKVPYPIEKPLSKWDRICLKSGSIAIKLGRYGREDSCGFPWKFFV